MTFSLCLNCTWERRQLQKLVTITIHDISPFYCILLFKIFNFHSSINSFKVSLYTKMSSDTYDKNAMNNYNLQVCGSYTFKETDLFMTCLISERVETSPKAYS